MTSWGARLFKASFVNTPPLPASSPRLATLNKGVLLWREKIPEDWLPRMLNNLPAVLVDHAHLEQIGRAHV